MATRNCTLPWNWLVLDADGNALPCCQASGFVGNVRDQSIEEIWNGRVMRETRRTLQAGAVPHTCANAMCPYVLAQTGRGPAMTQPPPELDAELAWRFDDEWYVEHFPDVAALVHRHQLEGGLDHFVHHGRAEGREIRLRDSEAPAPPLRHAQNLIEFTEGRAVVSVGPKDLVIGVTNVCNLRCAMCPHGLGAIKRPHHLDVQLAEKLEPYIAQAVRVELVGIGEPMLAPLFWRIVELAQRHPQVFLRANSNAHFLQAENVERLVDSTFSELSISIDAATPETYAKIRGSDLELVRHNVRRLTQRRREKGNTRLEITTNIVLMRTNVAEAVAFVEQAADLSVDTVVFSQLVPMPGMESWVVERAGGWRFHYASEMIPAEDPETGRILAAAKERCAELGLKSQFILGADNWLRAFTAAL